MALRLGILACLLLTACPSPRPVRYGTASELLTAVDGGSDGVLRCPDPKPVDWSAGVTLGTITVRNEVEQHPFAGPCGGTLYVEAEFTSASDAFLLKRFSTAVGRDAVLEGTVPPGSEATYEILAVEEPEEGAAIHVSLDYFAERCDSIVYSGGNLFRPFDFETKVEGSKGLRVGGATLSFTYTCAAVEPPAPDGAAPAADEVVFQLRRYRRDGSGNVLDWSDTLGRASIDGGAIEDLGAASALFMTDPAWSPGGDWIAFAGGQGPYDLDLYKQRVPSGAALLAQAGTTDPVRLTTFLDDGLTVSEPAWNPADASRIACVLYAFNPTTSEDEYWIVLVDAGTGATIRELTPRAGGRATSPTWSPDGSRIAFTDSAGLQVVAADGSGAPRLVVAGEAAQPSWSPDGARIVYSATGAGVSGARLWVVEPDAAPPTPVQVTTEPGAWSDATPAWTSDSNGIVFTRFFDDDRLARLYRAAADGDGTSTELPSMAALTADEGAFRPQPFVPVAR